MLLSKKLREILMGSLTWDDKKPGFDQTLSVVRANQETIYFNYDGYLGLIPSIILALQKLTKEMASLVWRLPGESFYDRFNKLEKQVNELSQVKKVKRKK